MKCQWATVNPLMEHYHDSEWGVPVHDDNLLFEHLALDGFQAGLSWQTILNKRENFRKAFDNFNILQVASYTSEKEAALLKDPGIIRNRQKIEATIRNAGILDLIQREFGSFDAYIWHFTDGRPIHNHFQFLTELPSKTELSDLISVDMKRRGFKFAGSTIIYAFMQAVGIVNDHLTGCFRHAELNIDYLSKQ